MTDGDLRDQIARLESDIEHLAEGLERCRKAMLFSKVAIGAGGVCILAYFLGIRLDPTIVVGALAAIIGGSGSRFEFEHIEADHGSDESRRGTKGRIDRHDQSSDGGDEPERVRLPSSVF
jgi:hypothetical protein